jgi:NADH-quinone oxidoreductase subunit C
MTAEDVFRRIEGKFRGRTLAFDAEAVEPTLEVEASSLHEILSFLKTDKELGFDQLMCLSGVDYGQDKELGVTYHLCATKKATRFTVKVKVPRDRPVVPSVTGLWRTANWHEREAYDLFGITFEGHPDLRRILLPEDWEGNPLRKDYVLTKTYRGIRFKD